MIMRKFEDHVKIHSLSNELVYNSNALAGEVGEYCNIIKKIEMIKIHPEWIPDIPTTDDFRELGKVELSDVLFYLTRSSNLLGVSLDDLMNIQVRKNNSQSIRYKRVFLK